MDLAGGQLSMAELHVVSALVAKRSEVAGMIADLERQAAQQRADLVHVDAVLRLYAPDLELDGIPSRAVRRRNGWFKPGELIRTVLDILRVAPAPMPAREIAAAVMVERGLDPADIRTGHLIGKLVSNALTRKGGNLVEKIVEHRSVTWRVRQ
jgi:hypothetical protein